MPVQTDNQPAGHLSSKLATMEPALQHKKRVEPPFLKTTPAKSDFDGVPLQSKKRVPSPSHKPTPVEPIMQAKKRIVPDFAKTAPPEPSQDNLLQSKKRVEPPSSEKPIHSEPPLQSKRRTPGPSTTLTNGFYDNGGTRQEEYALLGNQDKFSENVKYRPRSAVYSRDISPPKQMKLQKKSKENRDPSPAPVVNVEQFRKPATPLAPRRPKPTDPAFQDFKESNVAKEPKVTRSPKQSQSEPKLSKTRKEEPDSRGKEVGGEGDQLRGKLSETTKKDSKEPMVTQVKQVRGEQKQLEKEQTTKKYFKEPVVTLEKKLEESSTKVDAEKGEEVLL